MEILSNMLMDLLQGLRGEFQPAFAGAYDGMNISYFGGCASSCSGSCDDSCSGSCEGSCAGSCYDSCTESCQWGAVG